MSMASQPSSAPEHAAIINHFELDRVVVRIGEPVTVQWTTANAATIRITLPDGDSVDLDARTGAGSYAFTVTCAGMVRASAYGWVGTPARASQLVGVFTDPEQVLVPIPDLQNAPMPVFGRTNLPMMDRSAILAALQVTTPERLRRSVWTVPPRISLSRSAPRIFQSPGPSWLSLGNRSGQPVNLAGLFMPHRAGPRKLPRWLIRRQRQRLWLRLRLRRGS